MQKEFEEYNHEQVGAHFPHDLGKSPERAHSDTLIAPEFVDDEESQFLSRQLPFSPHLSSPIASILSADLSGMLLVDQNGSEITENTPGFDGDQVDADFDDEEGTYREPDTNDNTPDYSRIALFFTGLLSLIFAILYFVEDTNGDAYIVSELWEYIMDTLVVSWITWVVGLGMNAIPNIPEAFLQFSLCMILLKQLYMLRRPRQVHPQVEVLHEEENADQIEDHSEEHGDEHEHEHEHQHDEHHRAILFQAEREQVDAEFQHELTEQSQRGADHQLDDNPLQPITDQLGQGSDPHDHHQPLLSAAEDNHHDHDDHEHQHGHQHEHGHSAGEIIREIFLMGFTPGALGFSASYLVLSSLSFPLRLSISLGCGAVGGAADWLKHSYFNHEAGHQDDQHPLVRTFGTNLFYTNNSVGWKIHEAWVKTIILLHHGGAGLFNWYSVLSVTDLASLMPEWGSILIAVVLSVPSFYYEGISETYAYDLVQRNRDFQIHPVSHAGLILGGMIHTLSFIVVASKVYQATAANNGPYYYLINGAIFSVLGVLLGYPGTLGYYVMQKQPPRDENGVEGLCFDDIIRLLLRAPRPDRLATHRALRSNVRFWRAPEEESRIVILADNSGGTLDLSEDLRESPEPLLEQEGVALGNLADVQVSTPEFK